MDKLMLFHGISPGCKANELLQTISELFPEKNVLNLWLDPYLENRAVAMFGNKLDKGDLSKLTLHDMLGEIINPTNKIFIRAYETIQVGAIEKLKWLFSSKKFKYKIETCTDLTDDCYVILFPEGWDAVLAVCDNEWKIKEKKLTMIPYFDCFEEPFDDQYDRLYTVFKFEKTGLQHQSSEEKNSSFNQEQSSQDVESENTPATKPTSIFYEDKIIPLILTFLNFEKALQMLKQDIMVKIDLEEKEVIITGPDAFVKKMNKILLEKHFKLKNTVRKFLALEKIQQEIQQFLKISESHLVLDVCDTEWNLIVVANVGTEVLLQQYLSHLVIEKHCLKLTSTDHLDKKHYLKYIEQWNSMNPHSQIFVEDQDILLLLLSYQSEKIMNTEIIASDIEKIVNKPRKINVSFQNRYFLWLIDMLKFAQAAERSFQGLSVNINIEKKDVCFRGYKQDIKVLKKLLVNQNELISLDDHTECLFSDDNCLQKIKKIVEESNYHIVLIQGGSLEMLIEDKNGRMEVLKKLIGKLVMKIDSYISRKENLHKSQLDSFVQEMNIKFQSLHIFAEEKKLLLYAFQGYNKDDADNMNNLILTQNYESLQLKEAFAENEPKQHNISMIKPKLVYSEKCLKFEILELQKLDPTQNTVISFSQHGIEINYTSSDMLKFIMSKLNEVLSSAKSKNYKVSFPGLDDFLNSEIAQKILEDISCKFQCYIEFPEITTSTSQEHKFETVQTDYSRRDYKSVILKTAQHGGLNIHLVQGNIKDMKLDMRIEFFPSNEGKDCTITTQTSSKHLIINLPEWKSPYCKTLRESLRTNINIIFQQATHVQCFKIGFSTSQIHKCEHPFPMDVIAEIIVDEAILTNNDLKSYDVFICETSKELVIKAFVYYLSKNKFSFSNPDEDCWSDLNPLETKIPLKDLNEMSLKLEVNSCITDHMASKSLSCYPILPSLELASCPCYYETYTSKKLLEKAIQEIENSKPDGLMIGESYVKQNYNGTDLQIFCFPEWGFNSKEHIQKSLKQCLVDSVSYETVHIVVPGLFGSSKFPVAFLVQIVFNTLDRLIFEEKILKNQRKIVLVVVNQNNCEVFKTELQKRYQKKEKKQSSYVPKFIRDWWSHENEGVKQQTSAEGNVVIKNKFPETHIRIWGVCEEKMSQAHSELTNKLSCLMEKSEETFDLNNAQIKLFENKKDNLTDLPVLIIFTKNYILKDNGKTLGNEKKTQGNHQNKKSKNKNNKPIKNMEVAASMKIQGLVEKNVKFYKAMFYVKDSKQSSSASAEKNNPTLNNYSDTDEDVPEELNQNQLSDSLQEESRNSDAELMTKHTKEKGSQKLLFSFNWLIESEGVKNQTSSTGLMFTKISENIERKIDEAYKEGKGSITLENQDVINFGEMHVLKNGIKKGLLRSQIIDISNSSGVHASWTQQENKKLIKVQLEITEKEFQDIKKKLEDSLPSKLKKLVIYRVQNMTLYHRFKRVHDDLGERQNVWHQVANEKNANLVCELGFHQYFSFMPSEQYHLGHGVAFSRNLLSHFSKVSIQPKKTYYLFGALVSLGASGTGQKKFRGSPEQQSASNEDFFMVFSDAQAYPRHLIVFQVE